MQRQTATKWEVSLPPSLPLLAWSPSYKNEWDLGFPSKEQASDMKLGGLGGVFVSKQASKRAVKLMDFSL
jgi:hypothetical protein